MRVMQGMCFLCVFLVLSSLSCLYLFHITTKTAISVVSKTDPDLLNNNENSAVEHGVHILGELNLTSKYAVLSTTTDNFEALSFFCLVPLTVLTWKRIGFDSVVVLVGAEEIWKTDPLHQHVVSSIRQLGGVVIFLQPSLQKSVMVSQVSRLFVPNILRSSLPLDRHEEFDSVYFVTSDADLWPLRDVYSLPPGKDILSLDANCCRPFSHGGQMYRMLPIANTGMRAGTWRELTRRDQHSPSSAEEILWFFVSEFGVVAMSPVQKGENLGWYLDQRMISILIWNWTQSHGNDSVIFVPRNTKVDQIDRSNWNLGNSIEDKIDAHVLDEAFRPSIWKKLSRLLRLLLGDNSEEFNWCVNYYDKFQRLFLIDYTGDGTWKHLGKSPVLL